MSLEELLDYKTVDIPSFMEVRTEKIEPITFNSSDLRYVFRLEPSGFLDENTLLQFKLNRSANATNDELRVNSATGALGAIKRVIFRVGDFIINDTDGVEQLMPLLKMMKKRRVDVNSYEAYYYGNQFHSKTIETADSTYGQIEPDDALNGYNYTSGTANSLKITTTPTSNFKYGIQLGVLIPALKDVLEGQGFPLYLCSEYKVYIEIEFNQPSVYLNADTATTRRAIDADLDPPSEVQILADYLIYPTSVLENARKMTQKEGGLVLDFLNWVKVEQQLTVNAGSVVLVDDNATYLENGVEQDLTTKKDFRIGMENKELHTLLMVKQKTTTDSEAKGKVFLGSRMEGLTSESIQIKVNGVDVFQEPVNNTSSQFDQVFMSLGYHDLQVERPCFFNDPNSIVSGYTSFDSGLQGIYKPLMYDARVYDQGILGSGTQIGRYPLLVRYEATPASKIITYGESDSGVQSCSQEDGDYDVNFYCALSRRAVIQSDANGAMNITVLS